MSTPDGDGVHGTVCTEEQYQVSTNVNPGDLSPTITCLTKGQAIGLTMIAQAAFLSLIAVTIILVLIGRNVLRHRKALPNGDWRLLRGPFDIYMLFLFIYPIPQMICWILSIRWAHNGIVEAGSYCTFQGIIGQIGELGVAMITLILTCHTFLVARWNVGSQARSFAFGIIAVATLFDALWVGLGNGLHKNYITPSPYWCWIGPEYASERLAGQYVWYWITCFTSIILNISAYFWTKDHLVSVNIKRILLYPLAYAVTILPATTVRWVEFSNRKVSSATIFFCVVVFNLSGAIDVLLFLTVRPQLLLFNDPDIYRPTATTPAISNNAAKDNNSAQPTRVQLVDDGEWVPPLRGNVVALSCVESGPDV